MSCHPHALHPGWMGGDRSCLHATVGTPACQTEEGVLEEEFWRPGAKISVAWVSDLKDPGYCMQMCTGKKGEGSSDLHILCLGNPENCFDAPPTPTYTGAWGCPLPLLSCQGLEVQVHTLDHDRSRCPASLHRSQKMVNNVDPRTQRTTQAQSLPPLPAASCISGLPAASASSPALFPSILFLFFPIFHFLPHPPEGWSEGILPPLHCRDVCGFCGI